MSLTPNSKLGAFEISGLLGVGGMGEVYRARDTKLGREVAIKVLPEVFAASDERSKRFEREARMLAALDHPNIAGIYDFQEADGQKFLVMQLVEGDTLGERIKRGPIPVDEALPIFAQIAEALEAAHDQGIVHRDLKPANIKVDESGRVKVLDFGLAKAFEGESGSGGAVVAEAPAGIASSDISTKHSILGTPAYMSPEQARGQTVDKRTDIWAFGCCLYEALTGGRTFNGLTTTDLLAAVIEREPDWEALPEATPGRVRVMLWRCLQKDSRRRLRDIGEARFELSQSGSDASGSLPVLGLTAHGPGLNARRMWTTAMAMMVLGGLAGGFGVWNLRAPPSAVAPAPAPKPIRRTTINLGPGQSWPPGGQIQIPWIALSPDGENLAYVALEDLQLNTYLRPLAERVARPLPGGEDSGSVAFSPDSQWLALLGPDANWKLPIAGGRPSRLAPTQRLRAGLNWSAQGEIYFNAGIGMGISRVADSGGEPEVVTELEQDEIAHGWPQVLPGGKAILFFTIVAGREGVGGRIDAQLIETGERRVILEGASFPRYVPTGHLIYSNYPRSDTAMAVPFDAGELRATGPAAAVLPDAFIDDFSGCIQFTFSNDGTLVYVPRDAAASRLRTFVWVDREGNEEPIDLPPGDYSDPRISADGLRAATALTGADRGEIHILDLAQGRLSRFTFDPASDVLPMWSPDGQFLYFASRRAAGLGLYRKPADGTGSAEMVLAGFDGPVAGLLSDGSAILVSLLSPETKLDIGLVNLAGDIEVRPLLNGSSNEMSPALSPDERWIAYSSDESGIPQVYVQPFPNLDGKWQISTGAVGGDFPVWGPDGKELFYATPLGMMRAPIIETEPSFVAGEPEELFRGPYLFGDASGRRHFDLSPDGKRFLVLKTGEELLGSPAAPEMVVVENWFEELKRLAPPDPNFSAEGN